MLSPKNKAILKSLANKIEPSLTLGKGEIDVNVVDTIAKALKAHELIKVKVLTTAGDTKDVANVIANKTSSELVTTIGHVVILYKKNEEHPLIVLG